MFRFSAVHDVRLFFWFLVWWFRKFSTAEGDRESDEHRADGNHRQAGGDAAHSRVAGQHKARAEKHRDGDAVGNAQRQPRVVNRPSENTTSQYAAASTDTAQEAEFFTLLDERAAWFYAEWTGKERSNENHNHWNSKLSSPAWLRLKRQRAINSTL
jgi:hypothetical protein